jgi:hypothetical protein
MTISIDEKISTAVRKNSFIFLNKAIHELCSHDDKNDTEINTEAATLSITLIQISAELVLTSYAVKKYGVRIILKGGDRKKNDSEIESLFESNELSTRTFNELKNDLQVREELFSEEKLYLVESFQRNRNKLVHLHCILGKNDRYDLKYEMIQYIVNIIIPLLSDKAKAWPSSEDIEAHLDKSSYRRLLSFGPYLEKMRELARFDSEVILTCLHCSHKTLARDTGKCFACNYEYNDQEFADCGYCNTKSSVIFDHLNIEFNDNTARGLCLNCNEDDVIYKCPKCEKAYPIEASRGDNICEDGFCLFFGKCVLT